MKMRQKKTIELNVDGAHKKKNEDGTEQEISEEEEEYYDEEEDDGQNCRYAYGYEDDHGYGGPVEIMLRENNDGLIVPESSRDSAFFNKDNIDPADAELMNNEDPNNLIEASIENVDPSPEKPRKDDGEEHKTSAAGQEEVQPEQATAVVKKKKNPPQKMIMKKFEYQHDDEP